MKTFSIYFLAFLVFSCNSNSDILPSEVWSEGCATLYRYKDGYKLSGMCCEYLIIPELKSSKNNSFSSKAKYYTYTGSGYHNAQVKVTAKLSVNQDTLTLNYETAGITKAHVLTPGPAKTACTCGCD